MFDSFEWAHKAGVQTNANCIIGLPFETPEMIEDSITTIASLGATENGCNIFYPYKGTALRKVCEDNGFMPDTLGFEANDVDGIKERRESILNLPTITKEEILYYAQNWENLLSSQKSWRSQAARKARIAYGNFFYVNNRLPVIRRILERNPVAYSARKFVAKLIGY